MNALTPKQLAHRQYLQSPLWQEIRLKALAHYGAICNRCGSHGTDVHHKLYRGAGLEQMEDLEVLCRDCHEAEHRLHKEPRKGQKPRTLNRRAFHGYLTATQRRKLMEQFSMSRDGELYCALIAGRKGDPLTAVQRAACKMLGVSGITRNRRWPKRKPRGYQPRGMMKTDGH